MAKTELDNFLKRVTSKNRHLYTSGVDFELEGEQIFFIEVPAGGGSVVYKTEGGQLNTETMSAGYHPTAMTKIFAATAVNLIIIW